MFVRLFVSNNALQCGGAMHSGVTIKGPMTFTSNAAEYGRAVCVSESPVMFSLSSSLLNSQYNTPPD